MNNNHKQNKKPSIKNSLGTLNDVDTNHNKLHTPYELKHNPEETKQSTSTLSKIRKYVPYSVNSKSTRETTCSNKALGTASEEGSLLDDLNGPEYENEFPTLSIEPRLQGPVQFKDEKTLRLTVTEHKEKPLKKIVKSSTKAPIRGSYIPLADLNWCIKEYHLLRDDEPYDSNIMLELLKVIKTFILNKAKTSQVLKEIDLHGLKWIHAKDVFDELIEFIRGIYFKGTKQILLERRRGVHMCIEYKIISGRGNNSKYVPSLYPKLIEYIKEEKIDHIPQKGDGAVVIYLPKIER